MPGLNTAQIKGMARDVLGHDISESQSQQILDQAWDQSQYGADAGQVRALLNSVKQSEVSQPTTQEEAVAELENQISSAITELDRELEKYNLALTEEEREKFLQKAIKQVKPYYNQKRKEIKKGIEEGRIRNANDLLIEMRETSQEIKAKLKRYNIREAKTEEQFANTMADITATEEENLERVRNEWKDRIRSAKESQVAEGTLTSGVGRERISDLLKRKEFEKGIVERRSEQARTEAETAKKYNLKEIALSRERAEKERLRKLGTPEEMEKTKGKLRETAGYKEGEALPSEIEVMRKRAARDVKAYEPGDLKSLERERKRAVESRRQELIEEERAIRQQERKRAEQAKIADLASKYKKAAPYLVSRY